MRTTIWLGIAVVVAALAGCAERAPTRPDPAIVESFRLLIHPPPDLALAEHRLIQRCMRATGFAYPDIAPLRDEPAESLLDIPPPFTADQAKSTGYDTISKQPEPVDAVEQYARSLTPAGRTQFMTALNDDKSTRITITLPGGTTASIASRGCITDARTAAYGSGEKFLLATFVPQIAQGRVARADDDPQFQLALAGYAKCMSGNGYPVRSPTEAIELAATSSRESEIALAVTDVTCQTSSEVYEKYLAAANGVALHWIEENRAVVLDAAAAQQAAIGNARKILRETE